jgi:glycolate oxidase FAD binding subunit
MRVTSLDELTEAIGSAAVEGRRLDLTGGGSKHAVGAPDPGRERLDLSALSSIIDYDPPELVLTVGAATPLHEIETLVATHGQMLAFEPYDHGPLLGTPAGGATIGGVIAAAVSGSRRLSAGAARDHVLGLKAVSGRGEAFVAGGRVVKNVTGYDLPKLMAGSWGRLAALAEVTLKVLPAPRATATLVVEGLDDREACAVMTQALGTAADVAAAAHLPAVSTGDRARTLLRLEGIPESIPARVARLQLLAGGEIVSGAASDQLWADVRTLAPLEHGLLWRLVVPPSAGWQVVEALRQSTEHWLYDWAGGLVWLASPFADPAVRRVAAAHGGTAMLMRADAATRAMIPPFQPLAHGVEALAERVRRSFDPAGVFRTKRFGGANHAH